MAEEKKTVPKKAAALGLQPARFQTAMKPHVAVEKVLPHVFRVSTAASQGTGFFLTYSIQNTWCAIATAAHCVEHEFEWNLPIRIEQPATGKSQLLNAVAGERIIFMRSAEDVAVILFKPSTLEIPEAPLPLIDEKLRLKVGVDVAQMGYPAITNELCYFAGRISAVPGGDKSYLVDGVAINGVSGGPAFYIKDGDTSGVRLAGVVSAYIPNRATGTTLPGLSVIRRLDEIHVIIRFLKSLDEAQEKAVEESDVPSPEPLSSDSNETAPKKRRKSTKVEPEKTRRKRL